MTIAEAESAIHRVCRGDLPLEFTHHFWRRAHERLPGFRKHHAVHALRKCRVQGVPDRSAEYGNFIVRVRSVLAGFGPIEIVLAMASPPLGVAFVTIYKSR